MAQMRLMVFPFTVALDGAGNMRDVAQGMYARSLARTVAEEVTARTSAEATVATLTAHGQPGGTLQADGEGHNGWVVTSQPWTLEEACEVQLPEGTEWLLHGSAELTDRLRLRLLLVDQPRRRLALDHVVLRPREELFAGLDDAVTAVSEALGETPAKRRWPTQDVEAFVAYLRGRDMSAAHEASVHVEDPSRSFEGYLEATRRDARFSEAQERMLSLALDFALGGHGPVEAARAACRKLLDEDPSAFRAHAALAEIALAEEKPLEALHELEKVLKLQPEWWPAYERVGTALLRLDRPGDAQPWFEKALGEKPDDADALHGLGVCQAEAGHLSDAVDTWKRAVAAGHHSAHLHQNLAKALATLGRRAEAREHRAQARKLSGRPTGGPFAFLRDMAERLRAALGGS